MFSLGSIAHISYKAGRCPPNRGVEYIMFLDVSISIKGRCLPTECRYMAGSCSTVHIDIFFHLLQKIYSSRYKTDTKADRQTYIYPKLQVCVRFSNCRFYCVSVFIKMHGTPLNQFSWKRYQRFPLLSPCCLFVNRELIPQPDPSIARVWIWYSIKLECAAEFVNTVTLS